MPTSLYGQRKNTSTSLENPRLRDCIEQSACINPALSFPITIQHCRPLPLNLHKRVCPQRCNPARQFVQSTLPLPSTMCKAFFVRHTCNHCSAPRVEKCPKMIRFGECKGVSQIEAKSSKQCSSCTAGGSPAHRHPNPALISATKTHSLQPQSTANQKVRKTYNWMDKSNKLSQKTNPAEGQPQSSMNYKTTIQSQETISTKRDTQHLTEADRRKVKEAEARARNMAKKRDFQIALGESSGKRASKKSKADPKPNAMPRSPFLSSRWDLVVKGEAQATTSHLSPALTRTPSQPAKKPRKKERPKRLDLQDSNRFPKPRKPPASHNTAIVTPKSKTISSLSKLNAAFASKLRSLGYSPTLLQSALFSPAEMMRLAALTSVKSDSQGLRRSPRLNPEAQADVFLQKLGRQIAISSPKGVKGAEESPSRDELDQFERVMMESSSPEMVDGGRRPTRMMGSGGADGLFGSDESEEE
jgi:hypothetical protein